LTSAKNKDKVSVNSILAQKKGKVRT
jgi:hypothetical protein